VLRIFAPAAVGAPESFGHLLCALDFDLAAVREVALVWARERPNDAGGLAAAVRSKPRPHLVLAGGPEGTREPALMRDRTTVDGRAAAYVCESFACKQPVADPSELETLLG
jgi:hypothetical protein